jgi:hypothetical protein
MFYPKENIVYTGVLQIFPTKKPMRCSRTLRLMHDGKCFGKSAWSEIGSNPIVLELSKKWQILFWLH